MTLPGFKELLVGDSGTGKTHVIRTLLGSGVQPFVLATEPGFRTLAPCDNAQCSICVPTRNEPPIPYAYVSPQSGGIDLLIEQAVAIATKNQEALCKIYDPRRRQDFNQYGEFLALLKNPVDSEGRAWSPVTTWNTDRCLVVDAITELGPMAMDLYCGRRPLYDKPDYQIAQKLILNTIKLLTCQIRCHVIILAHSGVGENEREQGNKLTVSMIGRKLAPELPRLFDDMVWAERQEATFTWNTIPFGAVSKARNLPLKAGLKPDFKQVLESWKRAGGKIEASPEIGAKPK